MEQSPVKSHPLRGLPTLLKRGHCAPAVMETIVKARGQDPIGLVKLVGGMPGGIGNTGNECGGIASPLVLLGLDSGPDDTRDGLPLAIVRGRNLMRRFAERHDTLLCREIRSPKARLFPCIKAILDAPGIHAEAAADALPDSGSEEQREAQRLLIRGFGARGFHCSRAVLDGLPAIAASFPELRKGMATFLGGTACAGLTCSALVSGIMVLGRRLTEIENSVPRVLRMIVLFKTGGDAFADKINAFNATMNLGHRLADWFAGEFGSLQCREITGTDFSSLDGVRRFLDQRIAVCEGIPGKVASRVEQILGAVQPV